jgi:hypothetical protein
MGAEVAEAGAAEATGVAPAAATTKPRANTPAVTGLGNGQGRR